MRRTRIGLLLLLLAAAPAAAQQDSVLGAPIDSIVVEGLRRVSRETVVQAVALPVDGPVTFRDVQRAMQALYGLEQFEDVRVEETRLDGRLVLRISLIERPLLTGWVVRGVEQLSQRRVRGKVRLLTGRPFDPAEAAASRAGIDSLYRNAGYYLTQVVIREVDQQDGSLQVIFEVDEGRRLTVSQVVVEGNEAFSDRQVVSHMRTRPEGFWWWQRGTYDDDGMERDVREGLPAFYASRGYIDFQVLSDTLLVHDESGKATLQLSVQEGEPYDVGTFEIMNNRVFSSEQLRQFYPFGRTSSGFLGLGEHREGAVRFDQERWEVATEQLRTLYSNNGYMYASVNPVLERRLTADGRNLVDLRWQITERQPAILNKVLVRGNSVTHEDVIRRAILMVPGDVMRQDLLIRSYQNVSNLGFFEQPLPIPSIDQANQQGDIDVTFLVEERHTGNINFGASVGQGTGVGGFVGLAEPNLFGRGKQAQVQWQFGRYINNLNLSYTDPALWGSLISSTVSLHSSRLRYTVADLGRIFSRGASVQFGFPVRGSRFTRLITSYSLEQSEYESAAIQSAFYCENCVLSMVSVALVRDTRIDLPFPTGGMLHQISIGQGGGPLGGSGNFRRGTFEGRWYAPLATLGGGDVMASGPKLLVGLSTQAGFIWGDAGPHFRQLFSMGGTQFGIPLRGYEEFSITPQGFDPRAQGQRASSVGAFGGTYFATTAEVGLRLNQAIYLSTFLDAGNVWERPVQFNPTRLFRGAGVGISLVTPLGPIGLDYAYGFDRTDFLGEPDPGWKFHFRLGNIF